MLLKAAMPFNFSSPEYLSPHKRRKDRVSPVSRASPAHMNSQYRGRGGAYSYIRVLHDEFVLKSTVMTTDFKRNSSGRTRIYEYPPPN